VNLGKFIVGAFERFNALRVEHFDPEVGTALDELGLVVGRLGIYCWSAISGSEAKSRFNSANSNSPSASIYIYDNDG